MLKKDVILNINNVYTANAFETRDGWFIGAGSETDPVAQLYNLENGNTEFMVDSPGGMMSFLPVPGNPDSYVTIMGLFPPFKGKEAGLFLHRKEGGRWSTVKAMELPFAHRCEFIMHKGDPILIVAAVSKYKEDPADWSKPGMTYAIDLSDFSKWPWEPALIDAGIIRNHGMLSTEINGVRTVCLSGAEGIFAILPEGDRSWHVEQIFDKEVSEMTFIDLDGDGFNEMATIEPFHGNTLNIYKRVESGWELRFSDSLVFGHGLSSGVFQGAPVIVVGSRRESLALESFHVDDLTQGTVRRELIESGVGPTQTQVFSVGPKDYILSSNQKKNEVALYSGTFG